MFAPAASAWRWSGTATAAAARVASCLALSATKSLAMSTEVGPYVDGFKSGDRVNVYYYLICGNCRWCDRGRDDLCEHQAGVVGRQIDGGLAEYVGLPARNLCHLPPEISYVDAAVTADAIATPVDVLRERAQRRLQTRCWWSELAVVWAFIWCRWRRCWGRRRLSRWTSMPKSLPWPSRTARMPSLFARGQL